MIKIFAVLIIICSYSYGQMGQYNYKRKLLGISDRWHKIIIPNELYSKTSQDLTDIRIFGITKANDTIEAPILLHLTREKIFHKDVKFKPINMSHNGNCYFFTFEIPFQEPINQIKLDFTNKNFDWRIKLEGSQNQNEWFTIIENYRILSIKNDQTDYQFTNLSFPNSLYHFFRLAIFSKEKPVLNNAHLSEDDITNGIYRKYAIEKMSIKNNNQARQSVISIELQQPARVSNIKINIVDSFDYYRPVTIKYLADSIKTEQGWILHYKTLASGILSSVEKNEFSFNSTTVKKLKVFIDNNENQSLTIDFIQLKGYVHELIARFTEPANYYLTYGNKNATKTHYDIEHFINNINDTLATLKLGDEERIRKEIITDPAPLFQNKNWLWIIMITIILLLGWFSFKMIKKEQ